MRAESANNSLVFFTHNRSVNSAFRHEFSAKQTGPKHFSFEICYFSTGWFLGLHQPSDETPCLHLPSDPLYTAPHSMLPPHSGPRPPHPGRRRGELVIKSSAIAGCYLCRFFVVDLLSVLPLPLAAQATCYLRNLLNRSAARRRDLLSALYSLFFHL